MIHKVTSPLDNVLRISEFYAQKIDELVKMHNLTEEQGEELTKKLDKAVAKVLDAMEDRMSSFESPMMCNLFLGYLADMVIYIAARSQPEELSIPTGVGKELN